VINQMSFKELVHDTVYKAFWQRRLFGNERNAFLFSVDCLTRETEDRIMARKSSNPEAPVVKPNMQAIQWINRQLTEEEKEIHDSAKLSPDKTFKGLLSVGLQGYNFSLKWDAYSSCYQATLIPYNTANTNYGYGLSARAADPHRAISLLLYKHYEVLQEDWTSAAKPVRNSYEG